MNKIELIAFEKEIENIWLAGKIRAPVHFSGGNEDELIEIFKDIRPEDWVFSTHRSHYHVLLKGVPPKLVKEEILSGHSMHLNFKDYKFFTSSIVGGNLPIAVGVAMGIKMLGENVKVWAFCGDMASQTGIFSECRRYAKNFNLPIWFITEDNGFSVNSSTIETWSLRDFILMLGVHITDRWESGGIKFYRYERKYPHVGCAKWVNFV